MDNSIHCKYCNKFYKRIDMHLLEKHSITLGRYLRENYVSNIRRSVVENKIVPRVTTCLICNKKVSWLQEHVEDTHKVSFKKYLGEYFIPYRKFREQVGDKCIHHHHLLTGWDSYLIYKPRVDKMVNSLSYKKSLPESVAEELYSKSIELFLRFHYEYDPEFITSNPNFASGKTWDYYEKYMFLKVRRQLGYFIQKYYSDRKRELSVGTTNELEFYKTYLMRAQEGVANQELWDIIRANLKDKQVTVLDRLLLGYSQKDISEQLQLTQSWVSSIKTSILEVVAQLLIDNPDLETGLRSYYLELLGEKCEYS